MDASIMDGFTFKCGSVAAVSDIEHPITLAKYVMNNFPNSIFVGEGAKNLAKHADLNWISEGNMVSPAARIALHSGKTGEFNADVHDQSLLDIDILTNSLGTVGCVAYDGYSVAAGTTTGGLNKKLVGRVGDTPILGCGTYAIRNVGCSLTGHGESIMKLGLGREIVEDVKCHISAEEALHKHFSYMLKKFEQVGGGIVLQSDGRWATYFTSEKMPYAVIENDLITYGARLYEERREMYNKDEKNCECKCPFIIVLLMRINTLNTLNFYIVNIFFSLLYFSTAIERGLLNDKLFSFQEWQRYIECRKTILMHAHYPTKMKYCPDADGIDDLYLKFLEFISSKSNKNEREIKNSKHYLPEEIISAMGKHTSNLNINDTSPQAIDIFPPSLTPLHSYLQHLLDHPFYDIPNIARSDFFLTRVGYMTKSDALVELAAKSGIELEIVDSNVHFLEKNVPPFEQPRMPSIDELKQLIDVQDDLQDEEVRSESVNDYLHTKTPCSIKIDTTKNQYYDSTASILKDSANVFAGNDFTFTETLPNGKLAIPADGDSENKEDLGSNDLDQRTLLENKLRDKYNIHLSLAEKEAIHKSNGMKKIHSKKSKIQLKRNAKGQFIKGSAAPIKIEKSDAEFFAATENENIYDNIDTSVINDEHIEVESTEKNHLLFPEDINISDINIDDIDINIDHFDINDYLNSSDISFFSQKDTLSPVSSKEKTVVKEKDIFFRPFTEYWMYDCIFSRVKSKNFAIFEKSLPRTFRWLLNECALIVEMSTEDLYEEVCLIENYHSHISNSSTLDSNERTNIDSISKSQLNFILNKW
ncbi:TATA box-binding protein-associated factor RNA polymerase I subunit B isoform X5 [Bombus fervidus]